MANRMWLVVVCLNLKAGLGGQTTVGRLLPVHKAPPEEAEMFKTQVATEHQCAYLCTQLPACAIVVYRKTQSACSGYTAANLSDTSLDDGTKAWQITRDACSQLCRSGAGCTEGDPSSECSCLYGFTGLWCDADVRVNLMKYSAVTCSASSEASVDYVCSNAYDGTELTPAAGQWAPLWETVGAWTQIHFHRLVSIDQIELWPRCNFRDQAKTWQVQFDNALMEIELNCVNTWACEEIPGFYSSDVTPPIMTESMVLTVSVKCDSGDGWIGLREIRAWGNFIAG